MTKREDQQIDNYRLMSLLGTGQFGEVYLAEHTNRQIQALVAIKLLRPLAQDNQRDLLKFLREVRASHLKHDHIVQIHDFGVEGNIPFIVMEYAPNGTLRQCHPKGTHVPLPTIVSYVQQVASALQYMHDKRFIHRDVKPANMLIGAQDQILVSDFGVATISHSTFSRSQEEMAGTVQYIAPEQIGGQPRPASDQYSLAVAVYEWLCGAPPFQGTIAEVMLKHQTQPPPLLSVKLPTISFDVEQVVMRALAKDPKQRFDRVLDFAHALEQASLTASEQVTTVPLTNLSSSPNSVSATLRVREFTKPGICRRRVMLRWAMAGAAFATGGLAVWLIKGVYLEPPAAPPHPAPTPVPLGTVLSIYHEHAGLVKAAMWSPDGKHIASGSDDKTVQIWRVADTGRICAYMGHTEIVEAVAWSPDAKRVASGSWDNTVQVWDAADGSLLYTYKGHTKYVDTVAWSPDGKRIASGSYDWTVQVWNAADGTFPSTYKGHNGTVRVVAWSPDGKRIASGSWDKTVQVWDAADRSLLYTYRGHDSYVYAVAWSPDGGHIASGGSDGTVQVWNATHGNLVRIYKNHSGVVNTVAWSPDGKHVASGGVDNTVQIWSVPNGDRLFTYRQHTGEVRAVAWSHDGRLIASGGDDKAVQVWGTGV